MAWESVGMCVAKA